MKRFIFMKILPAVGLLLFAASCSDDAEDVRVDEKATETPVLNLGARSDLEDKIWQEAGEQTLYMSNDGKLVVPPEFQDISGTTYANSYYFADGKATILQRHVFGLPSSELPAHYRYTLSYTVDLQTGTISFAKADGSPVNSNMLPFEIEKVTSNELVIRDKYYVLEGYKYRRCVLTPVPKAEEQQWWDEYVDIDK